MSLINDMLRDLEARRAAERQPPPGLLRGLGGNTGASRRHRTLLFALLAALVLLAGTVAWLAWARFGAPQPIAGTETPTPAMTLEQPAPAAPIASAEPTSPPTTNTDASATSMAATTAGTVEPAAVAEGSGAAPATPTPPAATTVAAVPAPAPTPPMGEPEARIPKPAAERPVKVAAPTTPVEPAPMAMEKTVRPPSPQQQAEGEYQRGVNALRAGSHAAAESAFRSALRLDGEHLLARETLAAMLLGAGRLIEADEVLEQGRRLFGRNPTLALLLARLRVEQNQTGAAVTVLEQSLHAAMARADYLAFLAALYQRELRYDDSIESYGRALALQPQQASWWAGMGISLENAGRTADAIKAYQQAAAGQLPPQLQEHVRNRLKILQQ
jgi:MSHA biogenesis protein MshN